MNNNQEKYTSRDYLAQDRSHLANERTVLAYLRTSFAFFGFGVILIKFYNSTFVMLIAAFLVFLGIAVIVYGVRNFTKYKETINHR